MAEANTQVYEDIDDFLVGAEDAGNRRCWKFPATKSQPVLYVIAGTPSAANAAWQAHTNPAPPEPEQISASQRTAMALARLKERRSQDVAGKSELPES